MHLDDFKSVEDIMSIALQISYGETVQVFWPSINRTRKFQVHHYPAMDNTYNINGYVLIIRTSAGVYVTPIVCGWEDILANSSLQRVNMFVPFSNGDYPIEYDYWNNLCNQVWELRNEQLEREHSMKGR